MYKLEDKRKKMKRSLPLVCVSNKRVKIQWSLETYNTDVLLSILVNISGFANVIKMGQVSKTFRSLLSTNSFWNSYLDRCGFKRPLQPMIDPIVEIHRHFFLIARQHVAVTYFHK